MPDFEKRIGRLRQKLKKSKPGALLVTSRHNVTYLTGFTGDCSFLLVSQDQEVLITDSRFTTQLQQECTGLELHVRKASESLAQSVAALTKKLKLDRLGIESAAISLEMFDQLSKELSSTELVRTSNLVEALRLVKDRHEITEIKRSVKIAERAFKVIKAALRGDQSEKSLAADFGASNSSIWRSRVFLSTYCGRW